MLKVGARRIILWVIVVLIIIAGAIFLLLPKILADTVYPLAYKDFIKKYALENDIDPNLVAATIWTESRFRKDAVSIAGARGLMQLLPNTARSIARRLGEEESFSANKLFDPETNIKYGTWYLAFYVKKYNDPALALIAYNGGYRLADYVSAYKTTRGLNPETYSYFQKVQEIKKIYDDLYGQWWVDKKKEEKKVLSKISLPPIVLMIKNWLGIKI